MKAFALSSLVLSLLLLPVAGAAAENATDPRLWPEAQRVFWQEGPGLLLDDGQRAAFLALDEAGRTAFIQDFLDRNPELREGVRRRWSLAAREFLSALDARAQLLFLQGAPRVRNVIDCGAGVDRVVVDPEDDLSGCERVKKK